MIKIFESNRVKIDGVKLLQLLGISEEDCKVPGASERIANMLFSMTEEERSNLFSQCTIREPIREDIIIDEPCMLSFPDPSVFVGSPLPERSISAIKRDLKHCKSYLQRKALEDELRWAHYYKKRNHRA